MSAATAEDVRLIVRLQRADHDAAARILQARRAPLEEFVDGVAQHGLSIVLQRALAASPLRRAFAPAQLERLEQGRSRQLARTGALMAALEQIDLRFGEAGQRFMLLKGPYLAERFYGDVEAREFVDLDLLVPHIDRARVFELLRRAGYQPKSRVLFGEAVTCFFVHGFDFTDGRTQVDLHWCLTRQPSLRLDQEAMWARRRTHVLAGRSYDVLADEDEIVFAVLSLLRDLERGRPKVKNIVDLLQIVEALDAAIDWEALLEARRREGAFGPMVNVLALCLDIAAAHDLAPRLSRVLERHAARRVEARAGAAALEFRPQAYNLGNRLWCAGAYDTSLFSWALWWGLSLPFRTAVHRRPKPRAR